MTSNQLDLILGVVISATYLGVFLVLFIVLRRTRQLTRSRFGLATALVFFAAGASRAAQVIVALRGEDLYSGGNHVLGTGLDVLVALIGLFYLGQRRQFGALVTGSADPGARGKGGSADRVTGLPDRRQGIKFLRRRLTLAGSSSESLALLMVQVDPFGPAGADEDDDVEELAGQVGAVLRDQLRNRDFAARMGRTSFMIAMPGAGREVAIRVSQRIETRVQHLAVASGATAMVASGVAVSPDDGRNAEQLVKAAEEAVEYARRLGGGHFLFSQDIERAPELEGEISPQALTSASMVAARALLDNMKQHHQPTARHLERTARYAIALADKVGFPPEQLPMLRVAALLHDIGMLSLSTAILDKKGKLTADEYLMVREHPQIGYQMVRRIPGLEQAAVFILYHHESFAGHGYPENLEGSEIPLGSRIISVAEAFDTCHAGTAYQGPLSLAEVRRRLTTASGNQFDPDIVKVMNAVADKELCDEVEKLEWSEADLLLEDSGAPRSIIGRIRNVSQRRLASGN